MKVCQLCAVKFTAEKFLLQLVESLEERNHEVTLVYGDGQRSGWEFKRGKKVFLVEIKRNFNILYKIKEIFKLYSFFKKEKFDVVHCHSPIGGLVGRIAAKLAGVNFIIYTVHGFYFHDRSNKLTYKLHLLLEKFLGLLTDLILTVSREDFLTAQENKILRSNNIFYIGNGVDSNIFDPYRIQRNNLSSPILNAKKDGIYFGMVGRLVKEKGVMEFLESSHKLMQSYPDESFKFIIVGGVLETERDKSITKHINQYKRILGDSLILTGFINNVEDYINCMDVFCLPSYREGLPVSIIEAMMMNKYIVATNIRGSRELVNNKSLGILVEPKSTQELFDAFRYYVNNRQNIEAKLNSRAIAINLYEIKKITKYQIDIIEKIYKELILNEK